MSTSVAWIFVTSSHRITPPESARLAKLAKLLTVPYAGKDNISREGAGNVIRVQPTMAV